MSVPPRTPAPSAIDGYRRIARTPVDPVEPAAAAPAGVRRSRRIAGATRVVGLFAVIAVIAGTSIGLATADPKHPHEERAAQTTVTPSSAKPTVERQVAAKSVAAVTHAAAVKHAPVATPHVVRHVAAPQPHVVKRRVVKQAARPVVPKHVLVKQEVAAPAPAPAAELPFTGAADTLLMRLLLGGAALTLLGMLVQIAGTPLPAHAIERKRLASRDT